MPKAPFPSGSVFVRALTGDGFKILSGLGGTHFMEELERGADGIVTGFSFPEILLCVRSLFKQGKRFEAAAVFDHYCSLIRYEFQPQIALALRKYSYMRRGIITSDTRFYFYRSTAIPEGSHLVCVPVPFNLYHDFSVAPDHQ